MAIKILLFLLLFFLMMDSEGSYHGFIGEKEEKIKRLGLGGGKRKIRESDGIGGGQVMWGRG